MYNTISIPVIFNNGIQGDIIFGDKPYLILKNPLNDEHGIFYYDRNSFGYMQIDKDRENTCYSDKIDYLPTKVEYEEAIKRCCILYFAGKFNLKSNFFDLKYQRIKIGIRNIKDILLSLFGYKDMFNQFHFHFSINSMVFFNYEQHKVVIELKTPPFGLTWQKYFTDSNWLKNSKNLLT
jgi:hypothetical protein